MFIVTAILLTVFRDQLHVPDWIYVAALVFGTIEGLLYLVCIMFVLAIGRGVINGYREHMRKK